MPIMHRGSAALVNAERHRWGIDDLVVEPRRAGGPSLPSNDVTVSDVTREFDLDLMAPAQIRHFVRLQLLQWGLDDLVDVAELLVSEVVTNSIRHALAGGRVSVARQGTGVRVEVADSGGGTPVPRQAEPHEPTGRGLAIVGALADRWGVVDPPGSGKTVWFELAGQVG
jgi:anti-sigma regulatory factor (Ser/Thr protein kinase)